MSQSGIPEIHRANFSIRCTAYTHTKSPSDVEAHHIRETARQLLQASDCPMCSLADTVGVTVGDELAFEHGFDDVAQRVMDHPIAKRRGADPLAFRLADRQMRVGAGAIRAGLEFILQLQQWLNDGQYEHVSRQVAEVGRLLGGWMKQETARRSTPG